MQDKRTRRRLLTDMLFVGGALLGASALTRSEPFFDQLLEDQTERPAPKPKPEPVTVTKAYPSDKDVDDFVDCTEAYPSDSDMDIRRAHRYPSAVDNHAPPPRPGPSGQARPFWSWLG
ncbi:hypothetical protein DYH09_07640 [bacterium CPR1]|nr:hypothetical protein [bacterium CPR1]